MSNHLTFGPGRAERYAAYSGSYRAPPSLYKPPPMPKDMLPGGYDRGIAGWPDPYAAHVRPYMTGRRANRKTDWGQPFELKI